MGITALGFMGAQKLSIDGPQRAMGQITSSFALGQMIGPTLAGYLHEQLGSFRLPTLLAVGALVLAALFAVSAELIPRCLRGVAETKMSVSHSSERAKS
jgi:MFS family permease